MKIYDCFTFYNEFDLLELRLRELYDVVDRFVIVEANRTFQNQPKPFYLSDNIARFDQWMDKITIIKVTDMPESGSTWDREEHQRNAIMRGVSGADGQDYVIISDVDEIPRAKGLKAIKESNPAALSDFYALIMPLFNFRFNFMLTSHDKYSCWGQIVRRRYLNDLTPEFIRRNRHSCHTWPNAAMVDHGGWHFSWLGDDDFVRDKLQSFAHDECNTPEKVAQIDVDRCLREGTMWDASAPQRMVPVKFDSYFPETIQQNPDKYRQYILDAPDALTVTQQLKQP